MQRILLLLLTVITILSCSNDDDNNVTPTNCDLITLISASEFADGPSDAVTISSLTITDNCLKINFGASGCDGDTWQLNLIDSGTVMESDPPQRNLRLSLRNEEACLAFITQELDFDISNLQVEGNQVILNITNSNQSIPYDY
ncbi:hypothetical protein [Aquimarina litoralis]|uniref:hypothetical protein n=1 Tax=Aquimarina litoralis TaxID=584605 RepID=UPI001C567559|nr:hypothetical protein [Aquimarina litoralis]MBW1297343.1 hypothetical protein [Aquimarina litoralis]